MEHIFKFLILFICFPTLVYGQVASQNPHGDTRLGLSCSSCHSSEGWSPVLEDMAFYHDVQTSFPLTGAHQQVQCANCHIDLRFDEPTSAANECATCHIDVHQGNLSTNCTDCHNTTSFQDVAGIEVHANTSFPLTGTHAQLSCISCHVDDVGGAFTPLETGCYDCHQDDYQNALILDHLTAGFPLECESCHNDLQWQGIVFDHVAESNGFSLLGSHETAPCASCHQSPGLTPIFAATNDQDCFTCHVDDYEDEHGGSNFPTTCIDCHNQNDWEDADFDHAISANGFQLIGAHDLVECTACHNLPDYSPIFQPADDQDCITCHQGDYDGEHAGSGFPTTCLECHNQNNWDADFDHATQANGFQLLGAHETAQCETCHSMPDLTPLFQPANDKDCITCHQSDYDGEHAGSGFPTTCLECHNQNNWDADFDHAIQANGFQLLGAHETAACETCHSMPDLTPLFQPANDQDCITCHQSDYDGEHAGSGFPTTCLECHNQNNWDADFDHATQANGFQLLGAHETAACETCHSMPDLTPLFQPANDQDCITCHQSDYDGEHAGSGFPTTCLECHNQNNWDADFDHAANANGFQLLGAHETAACETCHSMPDLTPLFQPANDQDCITCHQSDYDGEHAGSGFPTTCLECHNQNNWDADFDHAANANGFQLLGAHDVALCTSCHNLPDYSPIFTPANDQDCITCHQSDYDGEHAGSGFPVTCADCHGNTTWEENTFDHDAQYFPIYSGKHRQAWDQQTCGTCHMVPENFALFSCEGTCHEHTQGEMDAKHREENGYAFDPVLCLGCHPSGN